MVWPCTCTWLDMLCLSSPCTLFTSWYFPHSKLYKYDMAVSLDITNGRFILLSFFQGSMNLQFAFIRTHCRKSLMSITPYQGKQYYNPTLRNNIHSVSQGGLQQHSLLPLKISIICRRDLEVTASPTFPPLQKVSNTIIIPTQSLYQHNHYTIITSSNLTV